MGHYLKTFCLFFICSISFSNILAQTSSKKGLELINTLILSDSLDSANRELTEQMQQLKLANNYDSLVSYVLPLGRTEIRTKNTIESAKALAEEINQNKIDFGAQSKLKIELSKLYFELGKPSVAFEMAYAANKLAKKTADDELLINSEYYLGDYALRTGDINALEKHIRTANKRIIDKTGAPYKITARVLNLMGAVMFFSTKQDSAQYYFESALKYIPNLEDNVANKLYLPAAISGNLFIIKLNKGEHTEASKFAEESLRLNQAFLNKAPNHPQAPRVKRNLALGYVNLSSLHFDLGDFDRSDNIMSLAYDFAQKNFKKDRDEYFYVLLGVAEVKNAKQEFSKALPYLNAAENCLNQMEQDNEQLRAYLYNVFGNNATGTKSFQKALDYFEKSDAYYENFNPGEYDSNRLYAAMNLGGIYAELGFKEKAVGKVKRAYDYIIKENGPNTYQENVLLIGLAEINLKLKNYEDALKWCEKSLEIYRKNYKTAGYDKLYFEEKKAEIVLLKAKAEYALNVKKDSVFLKKLTADLNEGIKILEGRKSVISSPESVNVLLENNKEVFDFSKKIYLELFAQTNNPSYLNQAISLHESALYNKIRVRLNLKKAISFSGVPDKVILRENKLRQELDVSPEDEEGSESVIESLIESKENWIFFLDSLRQNFPKYHKMRYATIGESLANIQKNIPENTSVVRYFFAEEKLYAFVVTKDKQRLFTLDNTEVINSITVLSENQSNVKRTALQLKNLYNKLWKPFVSEIKTKNVTIIPDGVLYNLSFETLTPEKITSFKELTTNSLLAKHAISYNYSLYLLDNERKPKVYENSFVAFAPEFTDGMKEKYKLAITDSLSLDKTYLQLLQQPFNVNLAKTYSTLFDGDYFLNENSTEAIFKQSANEHKIIHIGTHAESNNISPELSRLIFAKDVSNPNSGEDNSLYTYEVYNTSLNSNLAILTACETGKPSYQSGEGMISLAHAFNYAGSESILTSLWKIDERSSAEIIESFYDHINSGKSKDEALRLAKLDYIENTDGRTLAPQFWAGLVLMGDSSPIEISKNITWPYWILAIALILIVGMFFKKQLGRS